VQADTCFRFEKWIRIPEMHNKPLFSFLLALASVLFHVPAGRAQAHFSGRYQIICPASPDGCACVVRPGVAEKAATYYHAQVAEAVKGNSAGSAQPEWVELKAEAGSCFFPLKMLRPIFWENELCPPPGEGADVRLRPLSEMVIGGGADLRGARMISLGVYFPTYYNIANEIYHSGERSEILRESGTGKKIASVSKSFRADLDMEGTGFLSDGRVLNVGVHSPQGGWSYRILPSAVFGVGILDHHLYPYRSVALDFVYLCRKASLDFCGQPEAEIRRRLVGALLYLPKLQGVPLPDGSTHDGFVCAQDVGGAIRNDRVDLFVGPTGGGNPYLPECRQRNPLIDSGIFSVVPSDWRTYEVSGTDSSGLALCKRSREFEYRIYAARKALEAYLIPGAFCRP
jgi:hypothetical protein